LRSKDREISINPIALQKSCLYIRSAIISKTIIIPQNPVFVTFSQLSMFLVDNHPPKKAKRGRIDDI